MTALSISGIYGLVDPMTGTLKYIGQSKNIAKRFKSHCGKYSKYPVSAWIRKLKSLGHAPELIVIEEVANPIAKEKLWIDRAKAQGIKLLNIHEGGFNPDHALKAKSQKIWNVEGLTSPYLLLTRRFMNECRRSENIKKIFAGFSLERRACVTEEQFIDFELKMAHIALGFPKLEESISRWLLAVEDKINSAYPGKVNIIYVDT